MLCLGQKYKFLYNKSNRADMKYKVQYAFNTYFMPFGFSSFQSHFFGPNYMLSFLHSNSKRFLIFGAHNAWQLLMSMTFWNYLRKTTAAWAPCQIKQQNQIKCRNKMQYTKMWCCFQATHMFILSLTKSN